jgi:predicted ATPase/DNA-binding CsgD family transcriptional regulator
MREKMLMQTSIPVERDKFVGRSREIAEVKRRLANSMLVTLTGIGGVGKSRIALRYATERRRAFPDGVFLVDIGTILDPELVVPGIVTTLGFQDQPTQSPLDNLVARLASRRCLIVLDGCEMQREAVAVAVEAILSGCPRAKMIATSRAPLGVPGETILTVPPMSLPPAGASQTPAGASEFDAIQFLADRADRLGGSFQITAQNVEDVIRLCRRLDGIPIALELAAARLRSLTPEQILNRLDDRYELLDDSIRSAPFRQQTLRATIESSYDLCTSAERLMWARLSVFSGSFDLDAVEGVCTGGEITKAGTLDLVQSLIDKSILTREDHGRAIRYRLLDIMRSFGKEMLSELEDDAERRAFHAAWFFRLIHAAEGEWLTARQTFWSARLLEEHDNIQAALTITLEQGDATAAADCLLALWHYYYWPRGWYTEGRHWLNRCLSMLPDDARRARVVLLEALMAITLGDYADGIARMEEGRAIAKRLNDSTALAATEHDAGNLALFRGEGARAVSHYEKALGLLPQDSNARRIDTLLMLILACGSKLDVPRAANAHAEILSLTEPRGELFQRSYSYLYMSVVQLKAGNDEQARLLIDESLRLRSTINDPFGDAWSAEILAAIALVHGEHAHAAQLLGFASQLWESMAIDAETVKRMQIDQTGTRLQTERVLGARKFRHEFNIGAEQSLAQIRQPDHEVPVTNVPDQLEDDVLTPREKQVAALISEGLTNREIAQRLVIAPRTAETHLQNAMLKLGFTSRSQVASWYVKRTSKTHTAALRPEAGASNAPG